MKLTTTFLLALTVLFFSACSNNDSASAPQSADPSAANTPAAPVAAAGVQHYICPNNCAGSGGATAGNCPVCGSEYQHNAAFHNQDASTTTPTTTPTTTTPLAAGGVMHYTCPNNCAGSGGDAAGACPVCGTAYVHNAAFHSQQTSPTTTTITPNDQSSLSPLFQNNSQQPAVNVPRISTPSNASGVYHYICSKGCSGGSGMAGNCPTCGSALVHNQAYHQ